MSLATIHPTEHRVPEGSHVCKTTLCSNCTRRLFSQLGNLVFCSGCSKMAETWAQIWACSICKLQRKWGEGRPDDKDPKILNCARCADPTEHKFSHVA